MNKPVSSETCLFRGVVTLEGTPTRITVTEGSWRTWVEAMGPWGDYLIYDSIALIEVTPTTITFETLPEGEEVTMEWTAYRAEMYGDLLKAQENA